MIASKPYSSSVDLKSQISFSLPPDGNQDLAGLMVFVCTLFLFDGYDRDGAYVSMSMCITHRTPTIPGSPQREPESVPRGLDAIILSNVDDDNNKNIPPLFDLSPDRGDLVRHYSIEPFYWHTTMKAN